MVKAKPYTYQERVVGRVGRHGRKKRGGLEGRRVDGEP
jgi:hypothetical protein